MKGLLLDTGTLIWLALDARLGTIARSSILESKNVYVSSLSILELRIKQSYGKLPFATEIINSVATMQIEVLMLDPDDLVGYRIHNDKNRDPFDNALITIAAARNFTLVTSDDAILLLPKIVVRTLDAKQ